MAVEPVFPSGGKRLFTALAALLGWAGLTIQLYLILHLRWTVDASLLGGLINFFSFFTVLTNTLVAVVLTCALNLRSSRGSGFSCNPGSAAVSRSAFCWWGWRTACCCVICGIPRVGSWWRTSCCTT
ncbi:Integral membrane protein [Pseudomonas chlororaphis subsp. aureofaciens]|nr:Integral membrane protein [Pseudomonas chlororaphis subsp. aureofaciens]